MEAGSKFLRSPILKILVLLVMVGGIILAVCYWQPNLSSSQNVRKYVIGEWQIQEDKNHTNVYSFSDDGKYLFAIDQGKWAFPKFERGQYTVSKDRLILVHGGSVVPEVKQKYTVGFKKDGTMIWANFFQPRIILHKIKSVKCNSIARNTAVNYADVYYDKNNAAMTLAYDPQDSAGHRTDHAGSRIIDRAFWATYRIPDLTPTEGVELYDGCGEWNQFYNLEARVATIGDVNNDGLKDAVLSILFHDFGSYSNDYISVYINQGEGHGFTINSIDVPDSVQDIKIINGKIIVTSEGKYINSMADVISKRYSGLEKGFFVTVTSRYLVRGNTLEQI